MKVLFVTSVYPSEHKPAAGVFHQTQADSLKELGIEVTVISPVPQTPRILGAVSKKYRDNYKQPKMYNWNGIKVFRPRYLAVPGQLKWAQPHNRFAKAIKKIIDENDMQFDIIHAHLAMPSGGAAKILSQQLNIPYVLTLHGSDVNVYPNYSDSALRVFRETVKSASEVIAVSEALAEKTRTLTGVSPSVLPIGIDLEKFKGANLTEKDKVTYRKRLNLPINKIILVYVGRLVEEKGILELTEAVRKLDDRFCLLLIGDGPLYEEVNMKEKIIKTGQLPNEKVREYMQASDIFVLPSYNEGMPTVIVEALSLKLPVISSDVGGIPEIFEEYEKLLIKAKSSEAIVERVLDYIEKDSYSIEVKESLFLRMKQRFDVTENSIKLLNLYNKQLTK